jgi:hypothetical protein
MTKGRSDRDAGSPATGDATAKPGRDERLSAALRANLARRKVQARERKRYGDKPAEAAPEQGTHDSAGFVEDKRTR